MAQNRPIPYGYQMIDGVMTTHPEESAVVKTIFQMYTAGSSYLAIANWLTTQEIRYMPSKPVWNKNMVARILQNQIYTGTKKYPVIIEQTQFHMSQSAKKPYTHTESKAIKELKPFLVCSECGEKLGRRVKASGNERWYCPNDVHHISITISDDRILRDMVSLQNKLAHINLQEQAINSISIETVRLQNEIDHLLEQTELQVEEIKSKILKLASLRYSLCPDTNHTEQVLLEELRHSGNEVNAKVLIQLVEQIQVSHTAVKDIQLKCGTRIQRGENHE